MTGELSIYGKVRPIGGVIAKIEAARQSGVKKVIIPKENWQHLFEEMKGIEIIKVESFKEVLDIALIQEEDPSFIPAADYLTTPLTVNFKPMN